MNELPLMTSPSDTYFSLKNSCIQWFQYLYFFSYKNSSFKDQFNVDKEGQPQNFVIQVCFCLPVQLFQLARPSGDKATL